jgi:hypothetical protein
MKRDFHHRLLEDQMKKQNSLGLATVILIALSIFLYQCNSSTQPSNPEPEQPIANPSFAQDIQQAIFNGSCATSGCHDSTASQGLNLSQGVAYSNIVNVDSTQDASKKLVLPSDADNSYIVIKIEGRQSIGERMPLGRSPLSSVRIQNIKNWINNGASNN